MAWSQAKSRLALTGSLSFLFVQHYIDEKTSEGPWISTKHLFTVRREQKVPIKSVFITTNDSDEHIPAPLRCVGRSCQVPKWPPFASVSWKSLNYGLHQNHTETHAIEFWVTQKFWFRSLHQLEITLTLNYCGVPAKTFLTLESFIPRVWRLLSFEVPVLCGIPASAKLLLHISHLKDSPPLGTRLFITSLRLHRGFFSKNSYWNHFFGTLFDCKILWFFRLATLF